jgi:hypothetical protein
LRRQEAAGLPPSVPKVITEYGYSSFAGQVELELPGSMVNAETAAQLLTLGGTASYFYGLEPNWVFQEEEGKPCDTWGNLMLFQFHDDFKIRPIATFHASQLLTKQWIEPGTGRHDLYTATGSIVNADKDPLVTAYPVRRPDGRMSVLLFNKDPKRTLTVRLQQTTGGRTGTVPGPVDVYRYSAEQWHWYDEKGKGNGGFPEKNLPPERSVQRRGDVVTLPPYSISVVRTGARGGHWWDRLPGIG